MEECDLFGCDLLHMQQGELLPRMLHPNLLGFEPFEEVVVPSSGVLFQQRQEDVGQFGPEVAFEVGHDLFRRHSICLEDFARMVNQRHLLFRDVHALFVVIPRACDLVVDVGAKEIHKCSSHFCLDGRLRQIVVRI